MPDNSITIKPPNGEASCLNEVPLFDVSWRRFRISGETHALAYSHTLANAQDQTNIHRGVELLFRHPLGRFRWHLECKNGRNINEMHSFLINR